MINIIDSKEEIESLQNALIREFESAQPDNINVILGTKAGASEGEVMYIEQHDIWAVFDEVENRYWNAFGVGRPMEGGNVSITCEINFPFDGINRRIAGAFGKEHDEVVLLHRGKIGGGRKGIGKTLFKENYRGEYLRVEDGGKENDLALLGVLGSKYIIQQIALFVHEVHRIKQNAAPDIEVEEEEEEEVIPEITDYEFREEGYGKKSYTRKEEIEAICNHGIVVNELAKYLEAKGYQCGNDRKRDLFTYHNGKINRIFEVKTNLTNSSIYSAIGQVLLYSAEKGFDGIEKTLVLPEKLKTTVEKHLSILGLNIMYFKFNDDSVEFLHTLTPKP